MKCEYCNTPVGMVWHMCQGLFDAYREQNKALNERVCQLEEELSKANEKLSNSNTKPVSDQTQVNADGSNS